MRKRFLILALLILLSSTFLLSVTSAAKEDDEEIALPSQARGKRKAVIPAGELTQVIQLRHIVDIGDPDNDGARDGYQIMKPYSSGQVWTFLT